MCERNTSPTGMSAQNVTGRGDDGMQQFATALETAEMELSDSMGAGTSSNAVMKDQDAYDINSKDLHDDLEEEEAQLEMDTQIQETKFGVDGKGHRTKVKQHIAPIKASSENFRSSVLSQEDDSLPRDSVTSKSTDEKISPKKYWGFSTHQLKCGIALALLSVVDVMGYSIISPFFPVVAKRKNLSEVELGVVIATFSVAGIFASMVTGALLIRIGAKLIILLGVFSSAAATICFGFLNTVPDEYFFWLCLLCRIIMGIGSLSAFTALYAVIFQEFQDRSLTVIGVAEALCSVGGIVGPIIGGGLYGIGGYLLPFAFLGGIELFVLGVCAFLIPHVAVERQAATVNPARLLLNAHGLFSALFVIVSFTVLSFIYAYLSLFLIDSFQLTIFMVGVYFLILSIGYGFSTPIWGYISQARNIGAQLMTGCGFLGGIILSFFGPADFWMMLFGWQKPQKWLVIVSMAIFGISMGGLVMPTFGEMIVAAKQMKLQDNELAQYGLVSGLWNTVYSIGYILGPIVGGAITAKLHFNNTMAVFGAVLLGLAILKTVHLIYLNVNEGKLANGSENIDNNENKDERTVLLR